MIGLALKKKLGVHWICDLTDPWTDIYYFKQLYHLPFALRINRRMEREVLENADKLITCSYNFRELFLSKSEKLKTKDFEISYIGYDADNFKGLKSDPSTEEFVITYTGTIADSYNPKAFFNALHRLMQTSGLKLKLRFVGMASEGIRRTIKNCGIESITEFTGVVSHHISLEYLMKSTVLLLIVPQNENNEGIIPGKIFEYFASKKPIMALANPRGDVHDLINNNNWGRSFAHEEEENIYNYLLGLSKAWKKNTDLDMPLADLSRFESSYQAKILADMVKSFSLNDLN
jgi:glycosyltransferase involved in cell wall biosynthesis